MVCSMAKKPQTKPKLTDAERHKRFIEMAREVEASENPEAFDKAFRRVAKASSTTPKKRPVQV
jgi:hypothetical protein